MEQSQNDYSGSLSSEAGPNKTSMERRNLAKVDSK